MKGKIGFYGETPIRRSRIDGVGWALMLLFGLIGSLVSFFAFSFAVYLSVRWLQWMGAL